MLAKTSRSPCSSSFMMTNSLPQPVSMRSVSPVSSLGREGRVVARPAEGSRPLPLSRRVAPTFKTCSSRLPSRWRVAPFAAAKIGEPIALLDIGGGRVVGEVDRLGDRVVGVGLEGGLQLYVPLGGHVVSGGEDGRR